MALKKLKKNVAEVEEKEKVEVNEEKECSSDKEEHETISTSIKEVVQPEKKFPAVATYNVKVGRTAYEELSLEDAMKAVESGMIACVKVIVTPVVVK